MLTHVTVNNADGKTILPSVSPSLPLCWSPVPLAVPHPFFSMHDVCADSGPTVKQWAYTSTTNTSCCWVNSRLVHCWHAQWTQPAQGWCQTNKNKKKHVTGKAPLAPIGWNWIQRICHWLKVMSLDEWHRLPPIWANQKQQLQQLPLWFDNNMLLWFDNSGYYLVRTFTFYL